MRDLTAFHAWLEARRSWEFGYRPAPETQDCARWIAAGVRVQTGRDPLRGFAGRWTTELGAARVIRRHGGMARAVDTVLRDIPVTFAGRGDVAMTAEGALTFVLGDMLVGLDTTTGYVHLPRAHAVRAWSAEA